MQAASLERVANRALDLTRWSAVPLIVTHGQAVDRSVSAPTRPHSHQGFPIPMLNRQLSSVRPVDLPSLASGLSMTTMGTLKISRYGAQIVLPPSRKVRSLLVYLASAPFPVGRSRLCELLGDIPSDPRGELRWYLSKIRTILDEPGCPRLRTEDDMVSLDLDDCSIDFMQIEEAMRAGAETLDHHQLRALSELFVGEFLEGLELHRSPLLDHWLAAQRRRYRACHAAILEQLANLLPPGNAEALNHIEMWAQIAPFEVRAQVALLKALAATGRFAEGERHVEVVSRLFRAGDCDFAQVRDAWKALKQ